ncbi:MAG: heme o synthase [Phycisphaerales bacterium]|nr:heme o synthase [Phycisphaerales bacterium]
MSSISSHAGSITSAPTALPARASLLNLYMQLTKARLSAMVLFTVAVGFILASGSHSINWPRLLWTTIGTALAAGCASALNQLIEIKLDRRMLRTRGRPLPSGQLTPSHAFAAAMFMGAAGLIILTTQANLGAAWLALLTILIYSLLYTPMKTRTALNTLVGAVCGAIPPMIGWVAVTGSLDPGAWSLAAILFVWQIPHFLALAWMYRDDYQRGGFAMLPALDRDSGQLTCEVMMVTALVLVPTGLMASFITGAGWVAAIGSALLGLWMLALGARFCLERSHTNARGVFRASIAYLPALLFLLLIDR